MSAARFALTLLAAVACSARRTPSPEPAPVAPPAPAPAAPEAPSAGRVELVGPEADALFELLLASGVTDQSERVGATDLYASKIVCWPPGSSPRCTLEAPETLEPPEEQIPALEALVGVQPGETQERSVEEVICNRPVVPEPQTRCTLTRPD